MRTIMMRRASSSKTTNIMKKTIYILLSVVFIALFSSCNINIGVVEAPSNGMVKRTIHLSADEMIGSKAEFGDKTDGAYPMFWQEGDEVIVNVNGGGEEMTERLAVTPTNGGRTADFGTCTITMPEEGEVTIYVTTNTTTKSGGRTASIKYSTKKDSAQKPLASSCDPECVVLFAKKTYASADEVPTDDIKLSFKHATAYGLMSIAGIDFGGETVKLIELQASAQNIGGSVKVDTDGSLSAGSHEMITLVDDDIDFRTNPVWFAICPTTLSTVEALTVHVVTSGDRHFEKSLDCSSHTLKFESGKVSKFTVNFSGISASARQVKTTRDMVILKAAINDDDYGYWLNSDDEVLLANDINYAGLEFSGSAPLPAGVTFNGQNHSIQNATISKTLFTTVSGTVKNLTFQNATISTPIVTTVEGAVKNLNVEGGSNSAYLFQNVPGTLEDITINDLNVTSPLISSVSGSIENLTLEDNEFGNNIIHTISSSGTVEGITIDGGSNSTYLFDTVSGSLNNVTICNLDSRYILIHTVAETGIIDYLDVDSDTEFVCPWSGNNMSFIVLTNIGTISNSTVAATIDVGDPARRAFNFGVFTGRYDGGKYIKCVNKSNVSLTTGTAVMTGCGLGGIVGTIPWIDQSNSIRILDECSNEGNITLSLNLPASNYHRVCCVGGIVGGSYKAGIQGDGLTGRWQDESFPSSGVIYKCSNIGEITLNYNSPGTLVKDDDKGARGATIGGIVGATINDIEYCTNNGKVTGNFNLDESSNKAKAPKIGGVVGAAHNKVTHCVNGEGGIVSINGYCRNTYSTLYSGAGPIQHPCIGGVAGCVGCDTSANSDAAGSEISNCENKSASIINNATYSNTTLQIGSVCGWTVATHSGNTDLAATGLPVLNPE